MTKWNEPIHVAAHDPAWPRAFAEEAPALARVMPDGARVEHIGSTSVPGLVAKPIVDIQVGVAEPLDEARFAAVLAPLGYESMGEAGVPGRLYFRRRGPQSFNVHVVDLGGVLWRDNLALRDYLRAVPGAAERYGQHKRAVAAAGANDLSSYSRGKAALVEELIAEAQRWCAGAAGGRAHAPAATSERMRLATPAELDVVLALMQEYYAHDQLAFRREQASDALGALLASPALGEVWLIEIAGQVIGYLALAFGFSLECGGRDAFIDELFLRASHRGQGAGTRAVRHALSRCAELGIRAVRLEVMRHNPDALRLYTRLGFEEHDRYLLTHRGEATGGPSR
ncbi:MAG TPA: GNAT family N-acetyltransferase [Haliangium sp.]|nr:GNAT family N-acetyltransferase [Haliangium sp.]